MEPIQLTIHYHRGRPITTETTRDKLLDKLDLEIKVAEMLGEYITGFNWETK